MWKSASTTLSTRIRQTCIHRLRCQQRCNLSTEKPGAAKPEAPKPKEVPKEASAPKKQAAPPPSAPIPPPRRSKLRMLMYLLGGAVVVDQAILWSAWRDPDFQKRVEDYVPYSNEIFTWCFQYMPERPQPAAIEPQVPLFRPKSHKPEETGPLAAAAVKKEEVKLPQKQDTRPQVPEKPTEKPKVEEPKQVEKRAEQKEETDAEKRRRESEERKKKEKEEAARRMREKAEEEASENAALEVSLENLVESCNLKLKQAVEAQRRVVDTTKAHSDLLKKAMDDTTEILDKDAQWEQVATAFLARQESVKEAEYLVSAARENLSRLNDIIQEGKAKAVTKKNKALITARENHNKLTNELGKIGSEVSKVESEAEVWKRYKDLIEKGREQFKKELESITPDVKIGRKGSKLTEEELNSMIAHAHRRIGQLQKQLAEQNAFEGQRLQVVIEEQQKEGERLAEGRVAEERERLRREFIVEKDKWEAESEVVCEKKMEHEIGRLQNAFSQHLQGQLQRQEQELQQRANELVNENILLERQKFQTEVAGLVGRVRGIEQAIDARVSNEKLAEQAQNLWLACLALNGSIQHGKEGGATFEEQLKPLNTEVKAIIDASDSSMFVDIIARCIPEKALQRGVMSEQNLKDRFTKVRSICKRVAFVDENNHSLYRFFWSYVQSFFLTNAVSAQNLTDEIDCEKLDNVALLANAEYWIEHGNLEQALKFMNQLTGESRHAAIDWIEEARLNLEAQQAAFSLMAYASATGLGTIF